MPDPRPPLRSVQRVFWRGIARGLSVADAAAGAGAVVRTAQTWFNQAGGVAPLSLVEPGHRGRCRALGLEERERIAQLLVASWSFRAIAADLGRSVSTISREVRGHMRHRASRRYGPPAGPRMDPTTLDWVRVYDYSPTRAQRRVEAATRRPQPTKLTRCPRLRAEVQRRLEDHQSPEQIAYRLRIDFPEDQEMQVSHETIYISLYVQGRGELRRDLTQRLRTGRAVRRPRHQTGHRSQTRIKGMVNISERPAEVADRAVPGHWEGDLIIGAGGRSAIGTLVERATRYVILLHLPGTGAGNHGADAVAAAMITAMSKLPQTLRQTLTWDQGIEMANHAQIAAATDLGIYFCDPHSPWQRGTNENTNGLLRQYFPKGTNLALFGPDHLEHVARQLNNRPRKTLAWRKPAEALDDLLSTQQPPGVATTG